MSLRLSRRQEEQLAREARAAYEARERPWRELARRRARRLVAAFNAEAHSRFPRTIWPTFRAAMLAERCYLGVFCSGCKQETCIDITRIDWHPDASVNSLIPYLRCQRCGPQAPLPEITALWKRPRTRVLNTRRFRPLPPDWMWRRKRQP